MKTVVTVDRQLVKAIAIWSEQLAHQYCNIASQYCNLARNRTPDFTVKFKLIYRNVTFRFVENYLNCLDSIVHDAHVIDSDSNSEHNGEYNYLQLFI